MKIVRSYEWNSKRYCVIERDDGSRIEVKGENDMTDKQAMTKCPVVQNPIIETTIKLLSEYSDTELVAEIQRRETTPSDVKIAAALQTRSTGVVTKGTIITFLYNKVMGLVSQLKVILVSIWNGLRSLKKT